MENENLYIKKGNRYFPVRCVYDHDSFQTGEWLVIVDKEPGKNSLSIRTTRVDLSTVDQATVLRIAREIGEEMLKQKSQIRSFYGRLSDAKMKKVWKAIKEICGDVTITIQTPSMFDVIENAAQAVMDKIAKGEQASPDDS